VTRLRCFAGAATVTSVFFIDFCALVFRCGCASLWRGADAHCNVHSAFGRHCPWCAHGLAASIIPWALIVAAQAVVSLCPRSMNAAPRLVAAIVMFPVAGGIVALGYGLVTGYWR